MRKILIAAVLCCTSLLGALAVGQPALPPVKRLPPGGKKVYTKGRVAPPKAAMKGYRDEARTRHGFRVARLPRVTASSYDCRQMGVVPPVVNQGNCGSCWDFSGCSIATSAFIKSGWGKNDGSFRLSEQYVLDCGSNGGCNGDDNTTVLDMGIKKGLPTHAEYGPYTAREGRCNSSVKTFYKLHDWGFCSTTQSPGVASVQEIKAAIGGYGLPVGCAVAADDAFMNYSGGVFTDSGSTDIDHDVVIVGWDDTKGRGGCWIVRNSWGPEWGENGYIYMEYGANLIGTEAVWCTAPQMPGPTPPPGPVPPPNPLPGMGTITLPAGLPAGNYSIVPIPAPK